MSFFMCYLLIVFSASHVEAASKAVFNDPNAHLFVGFGEDIVTNYNYDLTGIVTGQYYFTTDGLDEYDGLDTEIGFVETKQELEHFFSRKMKIEVDGSYRVFSGSGSVENFSSEEIKIQNNTILLYAKINLLIGKYVFSLPEFTDEALNQINNDVYAFTERHGQVFRKEAVVAAQVVYLYHYEFDSSLLYKKAEFKTALKASIESSFQLGGGGSVELTETQKELIAQTTQSAYAETNVSHLIFIPRPIYNIDQFNNELYRLESAIQNPDNIGHIPPISVTYSPYSDIINTPEEYQEILENAMLYKQWQEEWIKHKNKIIDIKDKTTDDDKKLQCINALSLIENELEKINSHSDESRKPSDDEFNYIYYDYSKTFMAGVTGRYGGNPFVEKIAANEQLRTIKIWSTNIVYGIQVTLEDEDGLTRTFMHGKPTGNVKVLHLSKNEYVTEVSGGFGSKVDSIKIYTNTGRYFQNGGGGGVPYRYQAPNGYSIAGFCGRAYNRIDAIGVLYRRIK